MNHSSPHDLLRQALAVLQAALDDTPSAPGALAHIPELEALRAKFFGLRQSLSLAEKALREETDLRRRLDAVLRECQDRSQFLAITDSLTGLHNRRHFFVQADKEFSRCARYRRPLAVILVDVDRLRATARYGGEEFVILLPETDVEGAVVVAERIRASLEAEPVETDTGPAPVTASLGVSWFDGSAPPQGLAPLNTLIDQAEEALRESKDGGRNLVTVYAPREERFLPPPL